MNDERTEDGEAQKILITAAELASMAPSNQLADPVVYEITGPPTAYFELPLEWYINANAEIEPGHSPGAVRMVQRVWYKSFKMIGHSSEEVCELANRVRAEVAAELKRMGEIGYIWWRLYPEYKIEELTPEEIAKGKAARHLVRMRLGTMPALKTRFWLDLSLAVDNRSNEPLVPR